MGAKGSNLATTAHANEWTFAGGSVSAADLHTTSETGWALGLYSSAHSVNNGSPALAVGRTTVDCDPEAGRTEYSRGFSTTVTSPSMTRLAPTANKSDWGAYGVRTATPRFIIGRDYGSDVDNDPCDIELADDECPNVQFDAVEWGTTGAGTALVPPEAPDSGAQGRGTNESGDGVGYGYDIVSDVVCPAIALYWRNGSGSSTAYRPGDVVPSGQTGETWAEATTDRDTDDCVTLVGFNSDFNLGLIWYGGAIDQWCVED